MFPDNSKNDILMSNNTFELFVSTCSLGDDVYDLPLT